MYIMQSIKCYTEDLFTYKKLDNIMQIRCSGVNSLFLN